ncbi:hypothetical protein BDD12DRAFT_816298 [Trichophaea hybrida]|nr:hypothetical protein BDD12DRAFT_816298 [Trichophaea hybrida]
MTFNATCPYPFVGERQFPKLGGDTNARLCFPLPLWQTECCLPCPKQNYFYRDNFKTLIHATTYVNLLGVACCCFLLVSFAVLPVESTRRHYLSVCLAFAVLLMQMSFVIPVGDPGDRCFDEITPHDMYSSLNCALSGAFLLGGGWCIVMWSFLRTLSLHLQICWQVVPGRKFFLTSQAIGWSIPVIFLAIALSLTGVSFRFGESCHINSKDGVQTFWGPMLAMAAASIVTQSITFGYVTQVYIRSLFEDKPTHVSGNSHGQYSTGTSLRTVTASRAFRRIRKVVELQWRGITVVIIILADVIYFSTVFLQFDGTTQMTKDNLEHAKVWITCMITHNGDKNKCLGEAAKMVVRESTAFTVLFLLSFNGIWALLLLGRFSIYPAWIAFFKNLFKRRTAPDEFVSYNARRTPEPSSYEMLESKQRHHTASTTDLSIMKPEPTVALNSFREYNPSTFSAQLRGSRADEPPFSPFRDLESAPFSPYHDSQDSPRFSQFSPYADSPVNERALAFPREVRIGLAK